MPRWPTISQEVLHGHQRVTGGKPRLHVHGVLALRDGTTRGSHLIEDFVKSTLEVTLVETPARLRRKKQSKLGLALIDLAG